MGQLATENWLSNRYGVTFNAYPIYKTIKFTDAPDGPAKNDTDYYYLGISCSTSSTGVTGAQSNTFYLVNPTYTWITRVNNTYNSKLYDVYILTDYTSIYKPTTWNTNTGIGYAVYNNIKKIMDIIFVKVGASTPNLSNIPDYYIVKNKVNIPINEYQSIFFGNLSSLISNAISTGRPVNPSSGTTPSVIFNSVQSIKLSSTTYYYKLFLKRSTSLTNPDNASSVPVDVIRICQDERNILNVYKAGIYSDRYTDGSLLGENSGILTPYTENNSQVIINTKNTDRPGSLTSFFDNSFDTSLAENVCVTQEYFSNKLFDRIIYPSLYTIGPNTTSNNGVYCSGYISTEGSAMYQYAGVPPTYTGASSIKLFPPCISGIENYLQYEIDIPLNKAIIHNISNNLSNEEMNSTINSTTALYGNADTTPEYSFQINNVNYTTSLSNIPEINYNSFTSGFVKSIIPLSFIYNHPLNIPNYEGLSIGTSQYIMNVYPGVSVYPLLINEMLNPYITPGVSFPSLRKTPVYSSNYIVENPEADWTVDSNLLPVSQHNGVYTSLNTAHNSMAKMLITMNGLDKFILYIRSYGEPNYDYVSVSKLDVSFSSVSDAVYNSSKVYATTYGIATSGTSLRAYKKVIFDNIGGGRHTIDVVYRKDGSQSSNADKGYVIIPEEQEAYQNIHDLPPIPYHTIDHLPWSFNTRVYHPTLHNMTYSSFRTNYDQSLPELTSVNGYLSTPTLVIPSSIVRTGTQKTDFTASAVINSYNSCIDIRMTLPSTLGPFKIRPFAYHSSPSNNMFLSHDVDETVIDSVINTIDRQLSNSDQYDTLFANKVIKYKQSNSSTIYTATVHINHIGAYYSPQVTSTSGDLEITFKAKQNTAVYNTAITAQTVSNSTGVSGTNLYFRTSTHFPHLLSDSTTYRTSAITTPRQIIVAY